MSRSSNVSIIYSRKFLDHDTGINHPECSDRLKQIVQKLKQSTFSKKLIWIEPEKIEVHELEKIHTKDHLQQIKKICLNGGGYLDADTPVCPESYEIALLSAGAWKNGLTKVLNGKPTFWDLNLPRETELYVPKLLALRDIISSPSSYGI